MTFSDEWLTNSAFRVRYWGYDTLAMACEEDARVLEVVQPWVEAATERFVKPPGCGTEDDDVLKSRRSRLRRRRPSRKVEKMGLDG
jgi:hypothetical protein